MTRQKHITMNKFGQRVAIKKLCQWLETKMIREANNGKICESEDVYGILAIMNNRLKNITAEEINELKIK